MNTSDEKLHIVVFPWLAFGHMLPFLELSKSLARRGHLVSFITTPKNLSRLPKPSPEISHLIRFISFPLPRIDGLPDGAEATIDITPTDYHYLFISIDGLQEPITNFISTTSPKPDWILQDTVLTWITDAAKKACIRSAFFFSSPAMFLTFIFPKDELRKAFEKYVVLPPWVFYPTEFAYHIMTAIGRNDVIAIRTCYELEPEWLPIVQDVLKMPVFPFGMLPPLLMERSENDDTNLMEWLNRQSAKSVVYIALGSDDSLSTELLRELAHGLELAKIPFLWGLRRPFGVSKDEEILPKGFEERTQEFGKVVIGWVPQLKVLGHDSVGGFLTHCGWSSCVEGIQAGQPLVMLPIIGDQGLNAIMLTEKGVGVMVERKDDGSFTSKEVEKALKLVMVAKEGDGFRKKAAEMKELLFANEDPLQNKYLDDFADYLVSNKIA